MPATKQRIGGGRTNLPLGEVASLQLQSRSLATQRGSEREPLRPTADAGESASDRKAVASPLRNPPPESSVFKAVPSRGKNRAAHPPENATASEDDNFLSGLSLQHVGTMTERNDGSLPSSRRNSAGGLFQAEKRPWTSPSVMHAGNGSSAAEQGFLDEARNRPGSAVSRTNSVIEAKVIKFQKSFQNKNAAKFVNMQDAFR
jgi:hypothetical protein